MHGANRLASNSLLEGLVFAERIGAVLRDGLPDRAEVAEPADPGSIVDASARSTIQRAMTDGVGVLRSRESVAAAVETLNSLPTADPAEAATASWETTNLAVVAAAIAQGAGLREETRGSHWREDFPDTDDVRWRRRIRSRLRAPDHPSRARRPPRRACGSTMRIFPTSRRAAMNPTAEAVVPTDHRDALRAQGIDAAELTDLADRALAEDLGGGIDVTTAATVPPDQLSVLDLVARADGVVAGLPVAAVVLERCGRVAVQLPAADGDRVGRGDVLLSALGPTADLLTAERSALNLLCHLSGVATATARWADALAGMDARVRDTRKTTPGLRRLEKYAVRCGGGVNHRMYLSDAALVKDNHVVSAGGVGRAFELVRERFPGCRWRSRWTRWNSSRRCSRPGPTWCCWTTSRRSRCAPPCS